jgi:hypothetical protein
MAAKGESGPARLGVGPPRGKGERYMMWNRVGVGGSRGLVVKALAVVRSPVRTPPPRAYGGALVVWPGMPFPNLDGRIHQSLFLGGVVDSVRLNEI